MKNLAQFFILGLFLMGSYACSSSNNNLVEEDSKTEKPKMAKPDRTYQTVMDALRDNNKIVITGTDIKLRGLNTLILDSRPFFYVNSIPVGREFQEVEEIVIANNIRRVDVITSLSDLAIYGSNGNNGVIKIITYK